MSEPTTAEICDCANTGPDAINTCQRVIRGRVEPPCDCKCHKPTREQKCADLARAMNYKHLQIALYGLPRWVSPDCSYSKITPPDYFTSHEACHDLVVWMATQQRHIQQRFVFAVRDETAHVDLCYELRILTAEPAVIAEAAWLAIKEDSSASQ